MHNKLAHTAEHAFIGSLQKLLGTTLNVRKVEHQENDNSVFIKISKLDLEIVIRAEYEVNSLIDRGRKIKMHFFESLSDAKKYLPNLRANAERIKESAQPIRVIEIEDHDIAACAMDHVTDLSECEFFLVTRISKIADEYELNFVVGKQAKETAIQLSSKLLNVCQEIGANFNTIESTIKKLNEERKVNIKKVKHLTTEYLNNIAPTVSNNGKVKVIRGISYGLDDEEIRLYTGKKIAGSNNTVVIIANINSHLDDNASIVFARSDPLDNIDCNMLFKQYSSIGYGRGGGKAHFVTGIIRKERVIDFVNNLNAAIS